MRRFYITFYTEDYVRPYTIIYAENLENAIEIAKLEMVKVRDFLDLNAMNPATSGLFLTSSGDTAPCVLQFVKPFKIEDAQVSICFGSVRNKFSIRPLWRN